MNNQQAYFHDRLNRIKDPKVVAYLDPETGMNIPRRLSIGQIKEHNFGNKPGLFVLIFSVLLGAIAVIAAKYIRFVYAEIPELGTEALTLTLMDFGIAALLTFVIGGMIQHKTLRHMMCQTAGIGVMMFAMHNLIWMFPGEAAQVFPQDYIEQVRATTEPQSLYVVGATYTL